MHSSHDNPLLPELRQAQYFSVDVARIILLARLGEDCIINEERPIYSKGLILSHRQIFQGLEACRAENVAAAEAFWMGAAKNSMRHFFAFITRAVADPNQYGLDESHIDFLRKVAQQAASIFVTITEYEEIRPMLMESDDIELQQLADSFAPASQAKEVKCRI